MAVNHHLGSRNQNWISRRVATALKCQAISPAPLLLNPPSSVSAVYCMDWTHRSCWHHLVQVTLATAGLWVPHPCHVHSTAHSPLYSPYIPSASSAMFPEPAGHSRECPQCKEGENDSSGCSLENTLVEIPDCFTTVNASSESKNRKRSTSFTLPIKTLALTPSAWFPFLKNFHHG